MSKLDMAGHRRTLRLAHSAVKQTLKPEHGHAFLPVHRHAHLKQPI